ncbi:unnamed protein product [Arabidopsis lyrata]|uniref:F-box domain-containing protein n=1 Tax=Arabidopsis lyrata subsp. lyrata TaxID=81972 RepID=D7M2K8_ARALL|nr:putative F-box/LRR-repeat protein 23 [Arabidopsis lyrata subsp. lyrata]EFH51111.1 hypothetical protein ARALYDRAFT_911821 [Arabidopsis lyrata subsp. lyrata]CAH8273272.1 unnamed protein product [Arabidopsis lyrata]|eukprot:XP_002874852.1 putative F-box/LRR-repeat protein 23 [Arabidopsis lyrata subsp. lyrata]
MKDRGYRNWAELPSDLTSSILLRLSVIEILENAQKVCRLWRRVCKDPWMWRRIDMRNPKNLGGMIDMEIICRHAVDRSQGGLVEIDIGYFGTDSLLNYMADSSSNLRSLRLVKCNLITEVVKLPLLEDLEVSFCDLSGDSLRVVGQSCPNLKTLKLNYNLRTVCIIARFDGIAIAIAIAESMPQLRHLELLWNRLTNTGLNAILDSCPHLEHLYEGYSREEMF